MFVYNGHSYIGYGPLESGRFNAADFPSSYQLLFFNSCVSFNYYEKDYFTLKTGGAKNLDMVTNGLESWVNGVRAGDGPVRAAPLDGKQLGYKDILIERPRSAPATAIGQDALRVVDGELDNVYTPTKKPMTVTAAIHPHQRRTRARGGDASGLGLVSPRRLR